MSNPKSVVERFVDDRDGLSDKELEALVDRLRENPELAAELKEQLLLNELLSQRFAVDRRSFVAQIDQRVRDFDAGEDVLSRQVESLRSIAEGELDAWDARSERVRLRKFAGALAAVLLVAVAGGLWYWVTQSVSSVAIVDAVGDGGTMTRDQNTSRVGIGTEVQPGDRFQTGPGQMIQFRYADGTSLRVAGNSIVRFPTSSQSRGKQIIVLRGDVSAQVAQQSPQRPMILHSPIADAQVVGTSLTLSVQRDVTWLDVTNGAVRLSRRDGTQADVLVGASHYGVVTRQSVATHAATWPVNRADLVFLFQTEVTPNLAVDPITKAPQRSRIVPRGEARFSSGGAMRLSGGMFVAPDADKGIVTSCRRSGEFSLQATILPDQLEQSGPARIVSLSSSEQSYNLMIGQRNDRLVARLRTTTKDEVPREFDLTGLTTGEPTVVLLTFRPGRLLCYVNGEKCIDRRDIDGNISNWVGQQLAFGNELDAGHPWFGTIEGVAIFSRYMEADEARSNAEEYRRLVSNR